MLQPAFFVLLNQEEFGVAGELTLEPCFEERVSFKPAEKTSGGSSTRSRPKTAPHSVCLSGWRTQTRVAWLQAKRTVSR